MTELGIHGSAFESLLKRHLWSLAPSNEETHFHLLINTFKGAARTPTAQPRWADQWFQHNEIHKRWTGMKTEHGSSIRLPAGGNPLLWENQVYSWQMHTPDFPTSSCPLDVVLCLLMVRTHPTRHHDTWTWGCPESIIKDDTSWKVTAPLKNILLNIPKYLYTSIVSLVGASPEISTVTKVSFQTDLSQALLRNQLRQSQKSNGYQENATRVISRFSRDELTQEHRKP